MDAQQIKKFEIMAEQMIEGQSSTEDLLEKIAANTDRIADALDELVVNNHQSTALMDMITSDVGCIRDGIDHLGWMAHGPLSRLFATIAVAVKNNVAK